MRSLFLTTPLLLVAAQDPHKLSSEIFLLGGDHVYPDYHYQLFVNGTVQLETREADYVGSPEALLQLVDKVKAYAHKPSHWSKQTVSSDVNLYDDNHQLIGRTRCVFTSSPTSSFSCEVPHKMVLAGLTDDTPEITHFGDTNPNPRFQISKALGQREEYEVMFYIKNDPILVSSKTYSTIAEAKEIGESLKKYSSSSYTWKTLDCHRVLPWQPCYKPTNLYSPEGQYLATANSAGARITAEQIAGLLEVHAKDMEVEVFGTCSEKECRKWADFCNNWDDLTDQCFKNCVTKCTAATTCESTPSESDRLTGCGTDPSLMRASRLFQSAATVSSGSCPGSKAWVHAKCQLDATFQNTCDEVKEEIHLRVSNQGSGWTDPHNAGKYSIVSNTSSTIDLQRVTGNGKYTDKMILSFSSSGSGCSMGACSESQVTSVIDFSTNYCNLHDLYCSDSGCHVQKNSLKYTEAFTSCHQHDATQCLKV